MWERQSGTNRVIDEVADVAIDSGVNSEVGIGIMIIQIKEVRHGVGIVRLSTPFGFFVCYHLHQMQSDLNYKLFFRAAARSSVVRTSVSNLRIFADLRLI